MAPIGKGLVAIGVLLAVIGAAIWRFGHVPLLGHLPGDIEIRRGPVSFYFPIATCVLLSIVLTFIFAIFRR